MFMYIFVCMYVEAYTHIHTFLFWITGESVADLVTESLKYFGMYLLWNISARDIHTFFTQRKFNNDSILLLIHTLYLTFFLWRNDVLWGWDFFCFILFLNPGSDQGSFILDHLPRLFFTHLILAFFRAQVNYFK